MISFLIQKICKAKVDQYVYIVIFVVLHSSNLLAQDVNSFKYISGTKLTVSGRAALADSQSYNRINPDYLNEVPPKIQELATNAAGLNLNFQTNSTSIRVKWVLDEYKILSNMTPLAVDGLDLYGWNGKSWQYVSSAKPSGANNATTFIKNLDGSMRHYKVYLPLYSTLRSIKIGVEKKAVIKPAKKTYLPSKKVVIYGSSITQGASASRPGMAYPSIISRNLNVETLNLGFSGSGKMEIEIAGILGKMKADLFILDCVPNPSPAQIQERAIPFIKRLRALKPDTPILMIESPFKETGYWDTAVNKRVSQQNEMFRQAYRQLLKMGYKRLYYIPSQELTGNTHEETIDGRHLTDTGQTYIADRISASVRQILGR